MVMPHVVGSGVVPHLVAIFFSGNFLSPKTPTVGFAVHSSTKRLRNTLTKVHIRHDVRYVFARRIIGSL